MKNPANRTSASESEKTIRFLLTVASTLLVLAGFGLLVWHFYNMTALLGIVLIFTYLLLGPVNLLEKAIIQFSRFSQRIPGYGQFVKKTPEANPRILAVLIVYLIFFTGITISTIQVIPVLRSQIGDLGQKISGQLLEASDTALNWADRHLGKGTLRGLLEQSMNQSEQPESTETAANSTTSRTAENHSTDSQFTLEEKRAIQQTVVQNALNQLERTLASAVPNFIGLVGGTVNGFIYFLVGVLLTFYLLIDGLKLQQESLLLLPKKARATAHHLLDSFHQVMFSFIKGQVLLGLLTGGYMFIIYSLFNVPYAFLLGCVFALAELLPVVGTWIGIIIGLIVILLNMDPIIALWVWLCSYGFQTVKDNILAPKVVGNVMGLHPMVIILALLICAKVAGILGVLMALPLASAINVILRLLLKKDTEERHANPAKSTGEEASHA